MVSLIDIRSDSANIKHELLSNFRENFADAELSRTTANGTKKVIVPAIDPVHVTGFQVLRSDLISFVAALSPDVKVPDIKVDKKGKISRVEISLQQFLNNVLENAAASNSNPFENDKNALWIDFGYGQLAPRDVNGVTIVGGNELHLVFTGVDNGGHAGDTGLGKICATTAKVSRGGNETDPPLTPKVIPND